jgi:hypothetical protein
MRKTAMPVTAGTLAILAGVANMLVAFLLFIGMLVIQGAIGFVAIPFWLPVNVPAVLFLLSIPFIAAGTLALMGGIYSLQRRKWGLALVGSVAAFFPCGIFGLISVILLILSRDEFEPVSQRVMVVSQTHTAA